jgi:hypothetical protein
MSSINMKTIHNNWASRPADERYTSLITMQDRMLQLKHTSQAKTVPVSKLTVAAEGGAVILRGPQGQETDTTHWSFGQLCTEVGAHAGYLRKLPAELAAPCLQYGISQQHEHNRGSALLTKDRDTGRVILRALTSTTYGRIWNADVLDALIPHTGDGLTGPWKVPGEFGKRVAITKDNTTLYGSDHDMVIMLADEENRIELPRRRGAETGSLARGIIVGNSEVGGGTAFIAWFLFDYVCQNRIIWGLQNVRELSIRHTHRGPARWIQEAMPQVTAYAQASAKPIQQHLQNAQRLVMGDTDAIEGILVNRFDFSRKQANLIELAHRHDEGRPMSTVWDVVTGVTAYARTVEYADSRMAIERKAGKILQLAA